MSADFVAHMEDVLDLYAEPYDPQRPVVCFEETSTQLLGRRRGHAHPSGSRDSAQARRITSTGGRGPATCSWPANRLAGWRHVAVTAAAHQSRTSPTGCAGWWTKPTQEVPVVRVVLDNLNTHRMASLYEAFPAAEARRIAKRLEFHYTPKHGSWLNMAEIEFSVLSRCCLRQRLPDEDALRREVQALVQERNAARATINWRFNTQDARTKLHRLYPFDYKHD